MLSPTRRSLGTKVGAALLAAALLAFFALWPTRSRYTTAPASLRCRHLYAIAHTRTDTLAVDATPPFEWTNGNDKPLRCGELRLRGLIDTATARTL
jgi:hypothetical protein